ncbi:MAG: hemerythrin domain-containing protein [Candidatus Thermoplasmatota archaeon]|nr:hemerythrin domain-containing protein [Candidatus Thermoplasmatota archaeon]MDA8143309.1 hemerythrin domain-containing protein [Thermoplasmatales archaeon]
MADLAEILMVDHLAIRNLSRDLNGRTDNFELAGFHEYVMSCHVEIEEKIVFPMLKGGMWEDSRNFNSAVDRIKADHKLIDALAKNLIKWHYDGNAEMYSLRFPLYFKLLLEHNGNEESDLFQRWDRLDATEVRGAKKDAESIIDSFGRKRYLEIVGYTDAAFAYIFGR